MKELYRFRQFLTEGVIKETAFKSKLKVIRTSVKLPMRKIFRMLKDAGYDPEITDGNKITGIKNITIGVGDDEFSAGTLIISRNGQTFGNDLWGKDIKSENEIFPLIDEYYKNQLDYSTDTLDEGLFDRFRKNSTPSQDIFDVLEDYAANRLTFSALTDLTDEYKHIMKGLSSDRLMQANWTRENIDKNTAEEIVKKIKAGSYDY